MVSARKARLKAMARRGMQGCCRGRASWRTIPATFLPTVQIGITLVGVLAGAFSGATIADAAGRLAERFALLDNIADGARRSPLSSPGSPICR